MSLRVRFSAKQSPTPGITSLKSARNDRELNKPGQGIWGLASCAELGSAQEAFGRSLLFLLENHDQCIAGLGL